jgi:hypothetical protein
MAEDKMKPISDFGPDFALDLLERRILVALETAPQPEIPADFAARIARRLLPRPALVLTPKRNGQRAAMACLIVLLGLVLAFAHRATGTSLYWFSLESIFCAQFALLAVWLVARSYSASLF